MHRETHQGAAGRPRQGYALLAVLGVIVLTVTVLSALSQQSLQRGLAAADARIRLQQRLGAESIQRHLLPRAAAVFDRLQEEAEAGGRSGNRVPTQLRSSVSIGGITFDVVLADESAKVNLNSVYHSVGRERTESMIVDVAGIAAARAARLTPAVPTVKSFGASDDADGPAAPPPAFRSWGEVFDLTTLQQTIGDDAALANVTAELTCWGSGGLNLRRASDESIRAVATCVLSRAGAERLVRRYRENPTMTLAILVQQEAASETLRRKLLRMFSETSTDHSLWIDASSPARRSLRTFSVLSQGDDGTVVNQRFAF
ncbi:hypothetical protein FYK55_19510 [Roseiconus nitratireducens]|uniref:General secretion pathway protein K n=1 Tax=Roseiconus nitratireducens TaxID=2605748 RepID=A0A5M6D473_9BACT|nr:hypothetical protein [Roseiconus nitratireducens]KAA5541082.1 hypothetical protein FYK55_19510 [Roseiconus nitratireducens]